jgi:hypothetical protein
MDNNYCVNLQLPVEHPLSDPSILANKGATPEIWFIDMNDVNKDFISWLDSIGLTMTYPPLIFYTPAQRECGFHIDGSGICDRAVMNWIVDGRGSNMHWYDLVPGATITSGQVTQAGTPYTRYQEEDVIHVHSQPVQWPSIVQTGIPHKITNYCNEPRWCISCDISLKSDPESGLTMQQAKDIFQRWIV